MVVVVVAGYVALKFIGAMVSNLIWIGILALVVMMVFNALTKSRQARSV